MLYYPLLRCLVLWMLTGINSRPRSTTSKMPSKWVVSCCSRLSRNCINAVRLKYAAGVLPTTVVLQGLPSTSEWNTHFFTSFLPLFFCLVEKAGEDSLCILPHMFQLVSHNGNLPVRLHHIKCAAL